MASRTLVLIFCLTLAMVSRIPLSFSQSTEILVLPNSIMISIFNNFSVDINITNSPDFFAFEVNLAYNPSLLNVSSVSLNIPWSSTGYTINEQEGTIYIYGFNWELSLAGNLSIATITFYAEKMGNTTLHLYETYLYDKDMIEIPHITSDGNVEILGILNLQAATDKQTYYIQDYVNIYGNVSMETIPINDSLIAIQVDTPATSPELRVFRTTTTGQVPEELSAEILSVTPCDSEGNPKSSFNVNSYAYFDVVVKNNLDTTINVLETVTLFDKASAPFGFALLMGPVIGESIAGWRAEILLPSDTPAGSATAYACLFSDFPMQNGTAYCPEKSATFQIISGKTTTLPPAPEGQASLGSFNCTFRLGLSGGIGTYNVYVTSIYKIQSNETQTNFSTSLLGDFNLDGVVGPYDFYLFSKAYGSALGDPSGRYFPEADFNKDEKIGPYDFYLFGRNYGLRV